MLQVAAAETAWAPLAPGPAQVRVRNEAGLSVPGRMTDGTQRACAVTLNRVLHSHLESEGGALGWGSLKDTRGGLTGRTTEGTLHSRPEGNLHLAASAGRHSVPFLLPLGAREEWDLV